MSKPKSRESRSIAAEPTPDGLADAVRAGDRRALARAITLVESTRPDHREQAETLLAELMPATGGAARLGVSGAPGVGKSTFIEAFGAHVIEAGHRIAVLAIDPSSKRSGGSILGDRTRMETLARNPSAFIRPTPAGDTLGGVGRRTREALLLCEAAGYDIVLVETVGVGQSETAVAEMTDMFVLLLQPGGGDELQGIKKGVIELADLLLINKADGDLAAEAMRSAAEYRAALHLLRPASPTWSPTVKTCSSLTGDGVAEAWDIIRDYMAKMTGAGEIGRRRAAQSIDWFWSEIGTGLTAAFKRHPGVRRRLPEIEAEVAAGRSPPATAARELVESFLSGKIGAARPYP